MARWRWVDELREVLRELGGKAHLEDIETRIRERGRKPPNRTLDSTVRSYLQYYSSDSKTYWGKGDYFHLVERGKGIWELRDQQANPSSEAVAGELEKIRAKKEKEGAFSPLGLDDARRRILAAIVVRQGQNSFRENLLAAYRSKCAVTDCDVVEALEAAHIVPYLGPATNHVSNGLLLRGDLHTLFDLSLVALNPSNYRILVSRRMKGACYASFAGQVIRLPADRAARPSREALETRLHEFRAKDTS